MKSVEQLIVDILLVGFNSNHVDVFGRLPLFLFTFKIVYCLRFARFCSRVSSDNCKNKSPTKGNVSTLFYFKLST